MSWLQVQVRTTPDHAEALETLLEEAGAVSVTMADAADQPLFEPGPGETPLWREILLSALFAAGTDPASLERRLREAFSPGILPALRFAELEERDWERAWMDEFEPMRFGRRLWICPSWTPPPDPGAVNLLLDPGLAFGTGTHPTTALCLQWLDSAPVEGQDLIDYGCGSGILGIASLLLGAATCHGVDNDPQALAATRENCARNGIDSTRFETWLPEDFARRMEQADFRADGLLANILAEPLRELAPFFASLVKPGGWLLLSGILEKQAQELSAAYRPWFEMAEPVSLDGWVRIEGVRVT